MMTDTIEQNVAVFLVAAGCGMPLPMAPVQVEESLTR